MDLTETTLQEERIYDGKIIRLRLDEALLPNGRVAKREVVEHNGGVCIAALTEEEELLFVRQFRYPYKQVVTELPAGKLEPDEDPLEAGKRELTEETARRQQSIIIWPALSLPWLLRRDYYPLSRHWAAFCDRHPDEDEFLDMQRIPLHEAVTMVMRGDLPDAKTQTAVLKVNEWLRRGRQGLVKAE